VPLAAPDEAVLLEDADDLPGDLILVEIAAVGIGLGPLPIMRVRAGNIDRDTQAVCALAIRACDQTTVIGALARPEIGQKTLRQVVELIRYALQRRRRPVDFRKFEAFTVFARQPGDLCHV